MQLPKSFFCARERTRSIVEFATQTRDPKRRRYFRRALDQTSHKDFCRMHVFRCRTLPLSYDYYNIFHRFSQLLLIEDTGLTHENLYSSKNNHYRKKSAALPAAALPFAAADRDWNRTARTFVPKSSLAIGLSGSAALPLPRVPPFLFYIMSLFCVYIFHA